MLLLIRTSLLENVLIALCHDNILYKIGKIFKSVCEIHLRILCKVIKGILRYDASILTEWKRCDGRCVAHLVIS